MNRADGPRRPGAVRPAGGRAVCLPGSLSAACVSSRGRWGFWGDCSHTLLPVQKQLGAAQGRLCRPARGPAVAMCLPGRAQQPRAGRWGPRLLLDLPCRNGLSATLSRSELPHRAGPHLTVYT